MAHSGPLVRIILLALFLVSQAGAQERPPSGPDTSTVFLVEYDDTWLEADQLAAFSQPDTGVWTLPERMLEVSSAPDRDRRRLWSGAGAAPFYVDPAASSWTDSLDGGPPDRSPGELNGIRRWTVSGDTIWEGRPARVVVDSVVLGLHQRRIRRRFFMDDQLVRIRRAEGLVVGRSIIDDDGRLLARTESGDLVGSTTLIDPSGDTLATTPATARRYRRFTRSSSRAADSVIEARQMAQRAAFRLETGPDTALGRRIMEYDPDARREAIALWHGLRDYERRERLLRRIRGPGSNMPGVDTTLVRLAFEAGDFATAFDIASRGRLDRTDPLREDRIVAATFLPFLDDPDRVLRLGIDHDRLFRAVYEQLLRRITRSDPAEPISCDPALCDVLTEQIGVGGPGITALGLLALYGTEPQEAFERARDLASGPDAPGPIRRLVRLFDGVPDGRADRAPLPGPSDGPAAWLAWAPEGQRSQHHGYAATIVRRRTGTNAIQDLFRVYRQATDSVKADLGRLVSTFQSEYPIEDLEAIASDYRSGDSVRIALADYALLRRRFSSGTLSSREGGVHLARLSGQAVRVLVDGEVEWEGLERAGEARALWGGRRPSLVVPPIREAWVDYEEETLRWALWNELTAIDPRDPALVVSVKDLRSPHPFYSLRVHWRTNGVEPTTTDSVRFVVLANRGGEDAAFELLWASDDFTRLDPEVLERVSVPLPPQLRHVVVDTRERWSASDTDPRWASLDSARYELRVDSIRAGPGLPGITLSRGCCAGGWTVAREGGRPILIEPDGSTPRARRFDGRLTGLDALYPEERPLSPKSRPPTLGFALEDRLSAVPMYATPDEFTDGWSVDTVRIEAEADDNRIAVFAVRHARFLEAGIVEGRREWLVRDSTEYRRTDEWRTFSVYLGDSIDHRRVLSGVSTGIVRYDPGDGVALIRSDTIQWEGMHWKSRHDGGLDSVAVDGYREVDMEWISAEDRARPVQANRGLTITPYPPPSRADSLAFRASPLGRLEFGDTVALRRELVEWVGEHPGQSSPWWISPLLQTVHGEPSTWATRYWDDLTRARLEAGDTVAALDRLTALSRPDIVNAALDVLDDPSAVLRLGIDVDGHIDRLMGQLTPTGNPESDPFAAGSAGWRSLIERRHTLRDPRLRDLGLYLASLRNPKEHYAEVLQRAEEGSVLAAFARAMSEGWAPWPGALGTFTPRMLDLEPGLPAPPPDASAEEWRGWVDASGGPGGTHVSPSLYVYARRLGWDPYEGFQERYENAESPAERAVFARLAIGVTRDFVTAERAATWLVEGGPLREVARTWVGAAFNSSPEPPMALAPILTRALTQLTERGAFWEDGPMRPGLLDGDGNPRSLRMALPEWLEGTDWQPPAGVTLVSQEELLFTRGRSITITHIDAAVIGPIRRFGMSVAVGPIDGVGIHGPVTRTTDGVQMIFVETDDRLVRIPEGPRNE